MRLQKRDTRAGFADCPRSLTIPGYASAHFSAPLAFNRRATRATPRSDRRNNAKLIADLAGVADRRAHYYCLLVLLRHADDPEPILAEGRWEGTIIDEARGRGGFGYDPHFLDAESGMTSAELPLAQKNERSHRGKAMRGLIAQIGMEA